MRYATTNIINVSASGFFQNGRFQTFPLTPPIVGTPPFCAAEVDTVLVVGLAFVTEETCGTGIFVAPPIRDIPGRLLAYAPAETTGCGAGGATTAFAGATGINCPFTTAENVDMN